VASAMERSAPSGAASKMTCSIEPARAVTRHRLLRACEHGRTLAGAPVEQARCRSDAALDSCWRRRAHIHFCARRGFSQPPQTPSAGDLEVR